VRAVRATGPEVEVVDVDEPEGLGTLVRIAAASICASDFTYIALGSQYVLGHELAGITDDGRTVAIESIFGCGECEYCADGASNLCASLGERVLGLSTPGGMSELFRVPEQHLVPLPDGLDVGDASLCEPGSVAWHSIQACGVGPETRVAVVGGGAIGLLAAVGAQQLGALEVALDARHPHQHEAREKLGIAEPTAGYDVVVEAAGSESGIHRAVDLARPRGTVVLLGLYGPGTEFPFMAALSKELIVRPSVGFCRGQHGHDYAAVAAMFAARPEIPSTLVTHRFPIDDASEAFRVSRDQSQRPLRVVVAP